jgi:hypothetical protein
MASRPARCGSTPGRVRIAGPSCVSTGSSGTATWWVGMRSASTARVSMTSVAGRGRPRIGATGRAAAWAVPGGCRSVNARTSSRSSPCSGAGVPEPSPACPGIPPCTPPRVQRSRVVHCQASGDGTTSPSLGPDWALPAGEGLTEALAGADVVVDVSNSPSFEETAVLEFFETSTRNIVDAEAATGVGHHVALSVVGAERVAESGYIRPRSRKRSSSRTRRSPTQSSTRRSSSSSPLVLPTRRVTATPCGFLRY